ncbi:agmatinase [Candidatus Woesearchaeota archaeon]|nr:agmatinase [Candidatus Woesearchaeota archaeon]
MKWMNLPEEYSKEDSYFAVFPISFEGNVTYGRGASRGAEEIIKASMHLEYYDEQFDVEAFENGIRLATGVKADEEEEMITKIQQYFPRNEFVVSLGGDHSVTIGCVKALEQKREDFSVVILDAHSDFFDSWNNSQLNHRCVGKRIHPNHEILSIGVRSMDLEEKKLIEEYDDVNVIKAYEFDEKTLRKELKKLQGNVYISIDADVFDPAFIRNTGTPEPGGFSWDHVIGILQVIFEMKKVVGADIVEFAPQENFRAEAFSLAKLAYKMMSLQSRNI